MSYAPSPTWSLEEILPGGVEGAAFRDRVKKLDQDVAAFQRSTASLGALLPDSKHWRDVVFAMSRLEQDLDLVASLASCTLAADARSTKARLAVAAVTDLESKLARAAIPLEHALGSADTTHLEQFLSQRDLADYAPWLRHLAEGTRFQLEPKQQALLEDLDRGALHGWGELYDLVAGSLEAELEDGDQPPRTVGINAISALRSSPDASVRKEASAAETRAWHSVRDPCAMALTHITGARQTLYDRLGIDALASSLHRNRVSQAVVDAVLAACDAARPSLVRYLERKAQLLGKERLDWYDLYAPLPGAAEISTSWVEAQELVAAGLARFHPELRDFAVHALRNRWVEAEPRTAKQPGAFCSAFPTHRQSRVFMTWADTLDATLTLAHELGHAYHNQILFDLPHPRQRVTSALAETASTFAEAVVRDAAVANAPSDDARLFMIEQQLQAGTTFLMNIPARFRFERQLYRLRRKGAFDPDELTEVMVACQQESYGHALNSWSPMFWASKLHFYISHFGFYNWPYTFGYLFSSAVYARAMGEGPSFLPDYQELLRRTGYEYTEVLGEAVLGEDLTDVAFWQTPDTPPPPPHRHRTEV
ncbi:MAG: M3 family oligoendopeptidase [Deltaproteobacteria bacterium]|nr:M3 family oligoendopeptidase [Deltaproteobacteria bacterium]